MILPIQNTLRTRIQDVLAELYELKPADIPDIQYSVPSQTNDGGLRYNRCVRTRTDAPQGTSSNRKRNRPVDRINSRN